VNSPSDRKPTRRGGDGEKEIIVGDPADSDESSGSGKKKRMSSKNQEAAGANPPHIKGSGRLSRKKKIQREKGMQGKALNHAGSKNPKKDRNR